MAVPHSYHCAPGKIHGGEGGKGGQAFTATATVYIYCYRNVTVEQLLYIRNLGVSITSYAIIYSSFLKVWCINQPYLLQ